MRYEYVGRKIAETGKTMWEIVGNLKNFGVGRLVKISSTDLYPELSFMKIVKVQTLPPAKREGENRDVIIWAEEIYRDSKKSVKQINSTDIAKFQLIPKIQEEEYLKRAAELKTPEIHIEKYISWPPLYKKLWEDEHGKQAIPKLKTAITYEEGYNYILKDGEKKPLTCDLFKGDQTVDEMFQEMVRLKKIILSQKMLQK